LSTSPQCTPNFFYIHRTCGGVSAPYRINLPARDIYAPAQDGSPRKCKTPVGNHGCLTHRQEQHGTRQLPLWRVAVSSRCLRLASAPPWEHLLPEISKSRIPLRSHHTSHHHAHQAEVHMQMHIEGMCASKTENHFSYATMATAAVASAQEVRLTR
jgi:hypothetical protein